VAVYLFKGADSALVGDAVALQVRASVGEEDRSMVLDEFDGEYVPAAVVEAAMTPPFIGDKRVVLARNVSAHKGDLDGIIEFIETSPDDVDLLLEWGSGAVTPRLVTAIKKAGGIIIDPSPPSGAKDRREWWNDHIAAHEVNLDAKAASLVAEWLGEDVARWPRLADALKAAYGPTRITPELLEPFLGVRGDVKPWDLTDAIDAGDAPRAIVVVRRMMDAGERHPLQILAQLHSHVARLARLDGKDVSSREEAEEVLGLKGFPAEKALKAYRSLGSDGVRKMYELLATADVDVRGGTGLDNSVVMDVLLARLARLARVTGVSRRS
jgi:DNA polymerase III delta subunit